MSSVHNIPGVNPESVLGRLLSAYDAYSVALEDETGEFTERRIEHLESCFIEAALEFCDHIDPLGR